MMETQVIVEVNQKAFIETSNFHHDEKDLERLELEAFRMEVRDQAYNTCKDFLQGPWKDVSIDDFKITPLGGGLTNKLYVCRLPQEYHEQCNYNCPPQVLLRIYGLIIQDFKAQIQESVVFSILAERHFGPRLFAVFPGGRLEEYLPCRTLTTMDIQDRNNSHNIGLRLATYHKMNMPVKKAPTFIMNKLLEYSVTVKDFHFEDGNVQQMFDKVREYNLDLEIQFVQDLIARTDSPVVFCHNDVQEGNLLYKSDDRNPDANPIHMIDFEYSAYNYRGFDIANHFCEWMYDYSHPQWPYYSYNFDNYPNREQQEVFIRAYLSESNKEIPERATDPKWELDFLLKEANRFALFSHLFWAFWSIKQAKMADIPFGYMEYCLARLHAYFEHKKQVE